MSTNSTNERIKLSAEIRLAIFFLIIVGLYILVSPSVPVVKEIPQIIVARSNVEISRGDISKKQVIFTFDGGDLDVSGSKTLDVLAKHGVKGSFFLTGKFVENNPRLVKRMHREGHEIYNHTYNHPRLTGVSNEMIVEELNRMEVSLVKLIGQTPKPYFRAPYGDRNQRVLDQAFKNGYQSIFWTIDAMDWQESEGRTEWEVKNIVLDSLAPGNIYLMHIGDNITGNILDELFTTIKAKGYNVVSLKQGL